MAVPAVVPAGPARTLAIRHRFRSMPYPSKGTSRNQRQAARIGAGGNRSAHSIAAVGRGGGLEITPLFFKRRIKMAAYTKWLPTFLAAWLLVSLIVVLVVDLLALFLELPMSTVSYTLWDWGRRYPAFYLLLGLLLGHIVFPLILTNNGTPPHK